MARYLFTWEMGQGLGHLVRYKGLVAALLDAGHDVYYLARDEKRVRQVNPQPALIVEEIQPEFVGKNNRINRPHIASPATLLFNCGFFSPPVLAARTRIWLDKIAAIRPTCIIADHSPTAAFANKFLNFPIVLAGNGFTLPPAEAPFRLFQYWRFEHGEESLLFEMILTEILNKAAALIAPGTLRFEHPSELYQAQQSWLMTFPELDCYGPRARADYVGSFVQYDFGENFTWPRTPGPRVFAYLKSARGAEALAQWAAEQSASLCLVGNQLPDSFLANFDSNNTSISKTPLSLTKVLAEADLAISNGSANTLAHFALAGIPQLAIPRSIENLMEARRLEVLGCGLLSNGDDPAVFMIKATALIANPDYRRAARSFGLKYRTQNYETSAAALHHKLPGA